MIKIDVEKLRCYYAIYCNLIKNPDKRLFKEFNEFAYIISRVGMTNCLKDFRRSNFNVKKLHDHAKFLLCFGDESAFADVDPDNVIPKSETVMQALELLKNKNRGKI